MKDILRIIALILFSTVLQAQSSFEFILQDSVSSACFSTFQDNQGYYISLGRTMTNFMDSKGLVLKYIDQDEIAINKFQKPDTTIFFIDGFVKQNGNYFIAGCIDDNVDYYMKNLYILELNPDLSVAYEKIYPIPPEYNSFIIVDLIVTSDDLVVISGSVDDPDPGWINTLYMAKLNMDGDLIEMNILPEYELDPFSELIEKPDNSGFFIIGDVSYYKMVKLDNGLNVTGIIPSDPNNYFTGAIGAKFLSSGNLIIGCLAMQNVGSFYDLWVKECDTNLNIIKDTIIVDDGMNVLPANKGLDFVDENNIWMATYPQLGGDEKEWQFGRIYLFDSEMNVKGAKYFGGTMSLYLTSLKATEDGGCIITGAAADGQTKGYNDVYIKKVMPEDIITNAENTPDNNDMDVLLYPVPVENILFIETYRKNLFISIFTSDGKLIFNRKSLEIPTTRIQVSDLKKGLYFYSVYDKDKIIQTGKIIKN